MRQHPVAGSLLFVLLLAAAAPGCSAESELPSEPLVERSAEGNTTTVRNLGGGRWTSAALVQEASIGAPEGEIEYQLGLVRAMVVADERIVVLDQQVGHPRVYDLDGRYLSDIGSTGDGPEQFARAFDLALSPDGRIFVRDAGKGRVFEVTVDGDFVDDRVVAGGLLTPVEGGVVWTRNFLRGESEPGRLVFVYRAFDENGPTGDTIRAPLFDTEPAWLTVDGNVLERVAAGGGIRLREVPFGRTRVELMSPQGEVIGGVSNDYRYEVHRADGSRMIVERVVDPFPVQRGEADWYRREMTAAWRATIPDWTWEGPDIPPTKAFYRQISADFSGRVWVMREGPGEALQPCNADAERLIEFLEAPCWRTPTIADVFDRAGEFLGSVELPDGLRVYTRLWARGDTVLAVIEDEDGTLYVRRYRLQVN